MITAFATHSNTVRLSRKVLMQRDQEILRDFALRYTAAWCDGNPASVAAFFAPDGSLSINGGMPAVGRNEITDLVQSFMTMFPDLEVSMDDVHTRGDLAVYHWTLTGTNSGPGGNGNRVRISGFEIWRLDSDGRISASLGHFDQSEYNRQIQQDVEDSKRER